MENQIYNNPIYSTLAFFSFLLSLSNLALHRNFLQLHTLAAPQPWLSNHSSVTWHFLPAFAMLSGQDQDQEPLPDGVRGAIGRTIADWRGGVPSRTSIPSSKGFGDM